MLSVPGAPAQRAKTPGRGRPAGQSALEFALLVPLLMLIALGILDLGRVYFVAITIANAAREGARYGIEHPGDTGGIQARVQGEASGTGIDLSDSALTTIDRVCPSGCASGTPIRIEVTYNLQMIVPAIFGVATMPVRCYIEMMVL